MTKDMTRRSFVTTAGVVAAAVSTAAAASALADEATNPDAADFAASIDWLGAEPDTPAEFAEEYDADVVVCGLGVAGVAAMRAAAEAGAKVIGVDKGTASRISNEMSAYGSKTYAANYPEIAATWEGADQLILNAVSEGCVYRNDIRILRRWMDVNGEAVDWFVGAVEDVEYGSAAGGNAISEGVEAAVRETCFPIPEHYDIYEENMPCIPGTYRFAGSGRGAVFMQANIEKAVELGAEYFTYTPAVKLLTDESGGVNGVVARRDETGEYIKINASMGVVLATGDFMNDGAMLRAFLPEVLDGGYVPFGTENYYTFCDFNGLSCNTGDGHRMAAWVGGKMQAFGATMSHFSKSGNSSVFGTMPYLMLDENGNRFMNEDVQGQQFCERIRQLPNRRAIYLFDNAWPEQMPYMPYGHGKLPNTKPEDVETRIEQGLMFKADTLEELLANFDIDVEQAMASIERYNELAHAGADTDFGKTASRMFALENPPYYGNYMTRGDDLVTMCGICSDAACHAFNADNAAIPGLFLAGNVQGNRFASIYPEIFMGYSVAMAMAMGREAGINVVAEA